MLNQSGARCVGDRFQVVGPVKETDLWPTVLVETRGTVRIRESLDERRGRAGT